MRIIKRNGQTQDVSFDKILVRLKNLADHKTLGVLKYVDVDILSQQVIRNIYDGISSSEIDELSARTSISMCVDHSDYGELASRITISNLHKKTKGKFSETMEILYSNVNTSGKHVNIVSEDIINIVRENRDLLDSSINYDRDFMFDYFGYKTLERSYLLRSKGEIIERPQHLWLRVSLGIHKSDIDKALETYNLMSQGYFTHATPTLFNAGTPRPAMSSCFLLNIEDSMKGIYKCLSDCAIISKNSGGIGVSVSDIRAGGSYINGTNGTSDGIIKMLRVFNETARYANQGSKRNGSFAIYIEPWHADIFDFLEMKKNSGDENLKCRDLFYALWIPDAFMRAVENDDYWYLMSIDVNKGLTSAYGKEFDKLYYGYVEQGNYRSKIKARELWNRILIAQIETGMPYMLYKDSVNEKSNQKNIGIIKSSNLCVAPETKILTSEGYKVISELKDKQVSVWNGEEFTTTTVRQTGTDQELVKVVLSDYTEIECTEYHHFYIKSGEEIIKYEAKDLESGMELIDYDPPIVGDTGVVCSDRSHAYLDGSSVSNKGRIPLDSDFKSRMEWISGYIDGNGCVVIQGDKQWVKTVSSDHVFIDGVKCLLNTLGCKAVVKDFYVTSNIDCKSIEINNDDMVTLKKYGLVCKNINLDIFKVKNDHKRPPLKVEKVVTDGRISDTYCFTELKRGMGVFNGALLGNCAEILIHSSTEEYGTCNISTVGLPKYIDNNEDGSCTYNFNKLHDIVKIMTRNMNKVIDNNFYPVPETKVSNMRHRPIAIGVQGLANTFYQMKIPFDSPEASDLNNKIFETIQHAALTESNELAKQEGSYETFKGSPSSEGIFQHNMWGVDNSELSGLWDWEKLKKDVIKDGLRNSLLTACPPTASTSQILGNYESFEPPTSNIFMRSTLSGDFPVINKYLVKDLCDLGLWDEDMKDRIIFHNGSIQHITEIPDSLKRLYKTVWETSQKVLMNLSADRARFIDQTQSLNLFMVDPSTQKLGSAHFYGWKRGLKTSMYYCRSRPSSQAQKFSVSVNTQNSEKKKQEAAKLLCSLENPESCEACSG